MTVARGAVAVLRRGPRESTHPRLSLTSFLAGVVGGFFYAAGNFGFLNVLGIRREVQWLLLLLLVPAFPVVMIRARRWLRQPLWWLAAATLVGEAFIRQGVSVFFLFDRLVAVYVVALVFSFSQEFADRALATIVALAAAFSVMVIVQATVVWFRPDVLSSFVLGYTTSTQAEKVELGHPLEYLGLVVPGSFEIAGHPFTRFRSFASEPSVVICTFLAPGIMALSYQAWVRAAALPILIFAGGLAASGTAWLSLALGGAAYLLLRVLRRFPRLLVVVPLTVVFLWYSFLIRTNVAGFVASAYAVLARLEPYEGAFNKLVSGTNRLTFMAQYVSELTQHWWGASFQPAMAVGMTLHVWLYAGVPAVLILVLAMSRIFRLAATVFASSRGTPRLMAALLYGMLLQVMAISEFGWMTMSGFLMLALIMRRLEEMMVRSQTRRAVLEDNSPAR